jgi:hypothetical protein
MPRRKKDAGAKGKSVVSKARAKVKGKVKPKTKPAKTSPKDVNSAAVNRSEGIRLFKLAGRPSKDDFIAVYGPNGPRMTWDQRAAAGVPAEKFQAALASAIRHLK